MTGMALWNMLPLESAVKIVRGNGRQEVAIFTDPYCAACQAFEQTLQKIDDVTLYVFMLPVIRPDQIEHSRSVWCSPDRAKAWIDLAMLKKPPEAAPTCDNPVNSIMALRESIGIRATPTVIFENGDRAQGNIGTPHDDRKTGGLLITPKNMTASKEACFCHDMNFLIISATWLSLRIQSRI